MPLTPSEAPSGRLRNHPIPPNQSCERTTDEIDPAGRIGLCGVFDPAPLERGQRHGID